MKILNGLKAIKEYQVSILIAFIIVSILYGIHMFRYEYIIDGVTKPQTVYRIDRITNKACLYIYKSAYTMYKYGDYYELRPCDEPS